MAYQGITTDVGSADSLYQGALKINSNFEELYTAFGDGTNLNFNSKYETFKLFATDTIILDFSLNEKIGYLPSPTGPLTLSIRNIPIPSTSDQSAITFSIFVNQPATPQTFSGTVNFITSPFSTNIPIRWQAGAPPTGNASSIDVFNFILINTGTAGTLDDYTVIGNLNGGYA